MIHRALVWLSLVLCGFVVASFVLFAHDQVAGASAHQQSELVSGTSGPASTGSRKTRKVAQPRRFIDNVAGRLESPFTSIVHTDNDWVRHGFPVVAALVVYGLGLGFLARFAQGRA